MVRCYKYIGFIGFLGFQGFDYFKTQNPMSLFWFSFFGFFAYFFIAKLAGEMPDERYIENSRLAREKLAMIPLLLLFLISFGASFPWMTKEIIITVSALGFAGSLTSYAAYFWYYDSH